MKTLTSLAVLIATVGALLGLSACTPTIPMEPASAANDPVCAEMTVRLPSSVDGEDRVWTNAQATAAWGTPSSVLVTCGLPPPAPTTQQCVNLSSVDWIVDESDSPNLRLTTYGREPAAQVYVDTTVLSADSVLKALAVAVQQLPKYTECTDPVTEESVTEDPGADDGQTLDGAP